MLCFGSKILHQQSAEQLPKREELQQIAIDWNGKSSAFGACFGCIRAVKGWLCCMNKPRVHNAAMWLGGFPEECFLIDNDAHPLSQRMLIPFSGASKHITFNRSCDFCLSQLQICVKMAFSLLTTKWRTSRRNLDARDPGHVTLLHRAVAKPHNCVLNDGREMLRHLVEPHSMVRILVSKIFPTTTKAASTLFQQV